jgi:hypothetical protein
LADLIRVPGVAAQIRLVAGLRWRILRNGLRRKSNRLDLIGMIFAGIFAAFLIFGVSTGFFAGTRYVLTKDHASWIAFLFWAIFLCWQVFPVLVAGFGAAFEFRTLLRFPLSLRAFYLIGLAYGFAELSAVAGTCWIVAMLLSAALVRPSVLPLMTAIAGLFLLLNVTLERLLASWIERLFARRRTREVFLGLFVLAMICVQFVGPLLNRYGEALRRFASHLLIYLAPFPPSLAGRAISDFLQQDWAGVLGSFAGLLGFAAALSFLLWLRFSAQYRGEELSETSAPVPQRPRARQESSGAFVLDRLSPQAGAIVRKELCYLLRNGFALLSLLFPPVLVLLFSSPFAGSRREPFRHGLSPAMLFPAMMVYIVFILITPAYNCFAFESRGIQTYFTAPLRFRHVFLAKNLVLALVLIFDLSLCIAVFAFSAGLPSLPQFIATLVAIVFAVAGQFAIANWSSLCFPRKLVFGQMRNQRQSGMAVLIAFGVQIVFAGVGAVILFAGRWTQDAWLPAEVFAMLSVAAVLGYFASLDSLSELAERKKEALIETLCR